MFCWCFIRASQVFIKLFQICLCGLGQCHLFWAINYSSINTVAEETWSVSAVFKNRFRPVRVLSITGALIWTINAKFYRILFLWLHTSFRCVCVCLLSQSYPEILMFRPDMMRIKVRAGSGRAVFCLVFRPRARLSLHHGSSCLIVEELSASHPFFLSLLSLRGKSFMKWWRRYSSSTYTLRYAPGSIHSLQDRGPRHLSVLWILWSPPDLWA